MSISASGHRVAVVWAATTEGQTNIYAAVSEDDGTTFAAPVRVNDVEGDARVNGEQAPRVAVGRDIVVAWQSRRSGTSQVRAARSTDGGRTFGVAETIHDSTLTGARGWSSLVLDGDGAAHVAWLDGRNAVKRRRLQPAARAVSPPEAMRTLNPRGRTSFTRRYGPMARGRNHPWRRTSASAARRV